MAIYFQLLVTFIALKFEKLPILEFLKKMLQIPLSETTFVFLGGAPTSTCGRGVRDHFFHLETETETCQTQSQG